MAPARFQDIRLSKHFTMLDFMNCKKVYTSGKSVTLADLTEDALEAGRTLCTELLEPLIEAYGPCSVSSGWRPEHIEPNFSTPHRWGKPSNHSAAADVAFGNPLANDIAPITLLAEAALQGMPFNRIITYAWSEFACLSYSSKYNRHALYENEPRPHHDKAYHRRWSESKTQLMALQGKEFTRENWRAPPGKGPQAYKRTIDPQHVRLSKHFTLLDFCRSERGLQTGLNWVPTVWAEQQLATARRFAEMLDPIAEEHGRISIIKGVLPDELCVTDLERAHHRWIGEEEPVVRFLVPDGVGGTHNLSFCRSKYDRR